MFLMTNYVQTAPNTLEARYLNPASHWPFASSAVALVRGSAGVVQTGFYITEIALTALGSIVPNARWQSGCCARCHEACEKLDESRQRIGRAFAEFVPFCGNRLAEVLDNQRAEQSKAKEAAVQAAARIAELEGELKSAQANTKQLQDELVEAKKQLAAARSQLETPGGEEGTATKKGGPRNLAYEEVCGLLVQQFKSSKEKKRQIEQLEATRDEQGKKIVELEGQLERVPR